MNTSPYVNQVIHISNMKFNYSEHPNAIGRPFGQEGRRATVYQLKAETEELVAIKIFKPRFRVPRMVAVADKLAPYTTLPGLRACRRTVISSKRNAELLALHPELTYAVLMPWIEGNTWQEIILSKVKLSCDETLAISRSLANVLVDLEENGLAHCDLSGPNIIVGSNDSVELVDLEEMYGPGFLQPDELPAGSSGYAHHSVTNGAWNAYADRFSGAVTLAEMLGWCDECIRNLAWGEGYFDPAEMQNDTERYRALKNVLHEHWGNQIAELFDQAWQSDALRDCPTFSEWHVALVHGSGDTRAVSSIEAQKEQYEPEPAIYFDESGGNEQHSEEFSTPEAIVLFDEAVGIGEIESEEESSSPGKWQCAHCGKMVAESQAICPWCEHGRTEALVEARDEAKGHLSDNTVSVQTDRSNEPVRSKIALWAVAAIAVLVFIVAVIWSGRGQSMGGGTTVPTQTESINNPLSLSGRVIDSDGLPINGIAIAAVQGDKSMNGESDGDGRFTLQLPDAGEWKVELTGIACESRIVDSNCNLRGYFPRILNVIVNVPYNGEINLDFEKATKDLSGIVRNNQGQALSGIGVHGRRSDGAETHSATGSDGSFTLPASPGQWEIWPIQFDPSYVEGEHFQVNIGTDSVLMPIEIIVPSSNMESVQSLTSTPTEVIVPATSTPRPIQTFTPTRPSPTAAALIGGGTGKIFFWKDISSEDSIMELYSINTDGSGIKKLHTVDAWQPRSAFTSDGKYLIFTAFPNVEKLNIETGLLEQPVCSGCRLYDLDVSINNEIIAMHDQTTNLYKLVLLDINGRNLQWLGEEYTNYERVLHPTWSPDGSKYAISANFDSQRRKDIVVMRKGSSSKVNMTKKIGVGSKYDAPYISWSPNGDWLAVAGDESNPGLYLLKTDGSEEIKTLIDSDISITMPDWSPDGQWIAYKTAGGIGIMSADGKTNQIIPVDGDVIFPVWQP